ncbi:hypothetical protein TNCV_4723111 [Trichonephila clavipes]|uniref:Uncharacterized protein n=1 Tax=Trichonephila clavipes TaxID=2585209 RepID=A0A8X6W6G4_TRICX|nr:hypothetical protein TNCV_4723111 [Trichonephila clavipes]
MAFLEKGSKVDLQYRATEMGVEDVLGMRVFELRDAIVRNRCLHLATGRTRDDIEKRIWQGQRRKKVGTGEKREGDEKSRGREK